ncbi:MAG: YtxH domain-containing protein [Clostridium sp.]|nr:YtxH domain-containing protein [Clostridium sp.]
MKRQYKQVLPLLTAAALASFSPMQALAENPQFAHDEATWARLQDNTMEYDELSLLVEEYNPNYQNEQASYNDTKNDDDAAEIRKDAKNSADDMYDSAEDLRDQAEDLSDQADDLSDQAEAAREAGNAALAAQLQAGAASYMAGYAPLMSAAAMTQNSALKSDISADSSYVDSDMRKIKHIKNQKGIVVSTQNLFNSYNQLRINADLIQKNVEVMEAAANAAQTQASIGMATQADVLKAQKNLQSIKSTQTETLSSLETLRQNLCMMTGWSYDAQPEIKEVPQADLAAIDQINLEADRQKALENNYDLQYSKRALNNMQENSTDKKNQERTVKNLEQSISASMTNLYNDIQQKKIAWQLAQAELATEQQSMSAVETKRGLGMVSDLEYLQAQSSFLGKQIAERTANMALFQAVETYNWAVNGYLSQK